MRKFFSHAHPFEQDRRVDAFRARLKNYLSGGMSQGTWGFMLHARAHPRSHVLPAKVLAVVTATDSAPLTPAMIAQLPDQLWLEGDPGVVALVGICDAPELDHEPVPGAMLRIGPEGVPGPVPLRISASDLGSGGMILVAAQHGPPPGWPR